MNLCPLVHTWFQTYLEMNGELFEMLLLSFLFFFFFFSFFHRKYFLIAYYLWSI